jgi:hypothetical protein
MKEERQLSRDPIGTAKPEEESKVKKFIRLTVASVLLAFIAYVCVMAYLNRT